MMDGSHPGMMAAANHNMYATGYSNLYSVSPHSYYSFRSVHGQGKDFAPENDVFSHEQLRKASLTEEFHAPLAVDGVGAGVVPSAYHPNVLKRKQEHPKAK
jgi:hypothetical protein